MGDPNFVSNVPDPLLTGKELPTFKFELEKSAGKVFGRSSVKVASVEELPISRGIAGASIELEPGGMRELHWHSSAAEWAFILKGNVRTTVISPLGYAETNDFGPGDVWYFPRGHGHMLQCLGDKPCHFILIFDDGYFSEFRTFSITDWLGHTSKALLAKNFGVPESVFDRFPKEEVYIAHGALPPAQAAAPLQGRRLPPFTHKYELLAQPPNATFKGGREWRVDSTQFPISTTMTGDVLELEPGALRELHWHPNAAEWQYVIEGSISVTMFGSNGRHRTETMGQGDVGYIPQGYGHSIENVGNGVCRVLIAFNAGIYEKINISQWIAGNPADVLATNFGRPAAQFNTFPKADVFIADGESYKFDADIVNNSLAVSPDERLAVASYSLERGVRVYDVRAQCLMTTLTGFVTSDDDTTLYAANSRSNSISVVDLKSNAIRASVPVGRDPYGAALSPDGRRLYSGDKVDNTLTVIDTATNKPIGTIAGFDEPRQAIVFARQGTIAYVLNKDLSIAVVDLKAQNVIHTIRAEPPITGS